MTKETSELLESSLIKILNETLKDSCPCHYPRLRALSSFVHDLYNANAVGCWDTNYLVSLSTNPELNFLQKTGENEKTILGDFPDIIYECVKCSTVYKEIRRQYSINFELEYFVIENREFSREAGADLKLPLPIIGGLYGFAHEDIAKCKKFFEDSTSDKFFKYYTEKQAKEKSD